MAPWLQSGWSPISRKRSPWNSACGATGRTQTVPVLGSVRYAPEHRVGPAGSRAPELPMKSCFAITARRKSAAPKSLTPADSITAERPPPGKPLDPKSPKVTSLFLVH